MSATNRGSDRIESDNYPTPSWCARRLLEACEGDYDGWSPSNHISFPVVSWLEPCAGEGAIVRAVLETYHDGSRITANDKRDCMSDLAFAGALDVIQSDFLAWPDVSAPSYDIAITNPPFSLAEDFVLKMLEWARWVCVLVRQGFVGHGRAEWMRSNMPDTYELPDRPSFASKAKCWPDGGCGRSWLVQHGTQISVCPLCGVEGYVRVSMATDAADYCWLVWTPERGRTWGRRVILPSTPLEERKRG